MEVQLGLFLLDITYGNAGVRKEVGQTGCLHIQTCVGNPLGSAGHLLRLAAEAAAVPGPRRGAEADQWSRGTLRPPPGPPGARVTLHKASNRYEVCHAATWYCARRVIECSKQKHPYLSSLKVPAHGY